MSLQISNLTGGYTKVPVIHHIDFTVNSGELVALIGLNGAGKSTLIKHIIGLMSAFSGFCSIDNVVMTDNELLYKQKVAYIPESPILYKELTLREHIELVGLAHGLTSEQALQQSQKYLKAFRLDERLEWFPDVFSKGMKQKVMIILAFMINVPLYIIDEPFLGLDPIAIRQLLQFINEKKENGASVLMSTHVLSTAEKQCDKFVFMHNGYIKAMGTLKDLKQQYGNINASLDDIYITMVDEA